MPTMQSHAAGAAGGSGLYQLSPEHVAGLVALVMLVAVAWLARRGSRLPRLSPIDGLLAALLGASAAIHAGLALGQSDHSAGLRAMMALDAIAIAFIARRIWRGSPAGRLGALVLVGSIGAYWFSTASGESPDQLGLATKLGEILALGIALRPAPGGRRRAMRSFAGSAFIALLVLGTTATSWIGAFRAAGGAHAENGDGHAHTAAALPGFVMPAVEQREPTPAERAAATELVLATRTALARYADPQVAAADGYNVAGMHGLDFHAQNPAYERDGRIFDPAHPEGLVYAVAPSGRPVLLGAMFQMPSIGQPGPAIGGPLTVWHGHEQVCMTLTPPGLAGLLSPTGMCPIGSFDLPLTSQMIHVWIVPGAPEAIGDLDDAWKRAYLQAQ